jgi:hypothetical protein
VEGNIIGKVETTKIAVISTKNGKVSLSKNYDGDKVPLFKLENGIYSSNTQSIDWDK